MESVKQLSFMIIILYVFMFESTANNNSFYGGGLMQDSSNVEKPHISSTRNNITFMKCSNNVNNILPNFIVVDEGHDIVLPCETCNIRTGDNKNRTNDSFNVIMWKWKQIRRKDNKWETLVIDNDRMLLSPQNNLVLEDVNMTQGGLYYCVSKNQYISKVYRMEIIPKDKRIQVYPESEQKTIASPPLKLPKLNIVIFTQWSSWTACNRCNRRGQRKRAGLCTVKRINERKGTTEDNLLFNYYPLGIPCHSSVLPSKVAKLGIIQKRKNELEWGYCFENCPTQPPVKYITDSSGNVIEVVESGKGFISLDEAKPTFAPKVIRKSIYQKVNDLLFIECPIDKYSNKGREVLLWQNGSQIIDAIDVADVSHGRIHIDVLNRIKIYPTEYWDTGSYSCWKKSEHIATIKIRIIKNFEIYNDGVKERILEVFIGVIILALFCICCNIFRTQRNDSQRYV